MMTQDLRAGNAVEHYGSSILAFRLATASASHRPNPPGRGTHTPAFLLRQPLE
ncbi:hypothetical protein ABH945_006042 [Paraburkholderia sp. GAS333]